MIFRICAVVVLLASSLMAQSNAAQSAAAQANGRRRIAVHEQFVVADIEIDDAVRRERIDLHVIDSVRLQRVVNDPGVMGLELVVALKGDPATRDIPIILLSAKAQNADVRTGLDAGADDYVTKPFEPMDLVDRVNRLLETRASKRSS